MFGGYVGTNANGADGDQSALTVFVALQFARSDFLIDRTLRARGALLQKQEWHVLPLTATEQDRYRINAAGTLTPVSADVQYSYTSTTHLVLTY